MKQKFFFVVMMAAMMAASVNLAGCSKDDGAGGGSATQPTSLTGTWVNKTEHGEIAVAMTFDEGNSVVMFLEGTWFFGTLQRSASKMTLSASQIRMESFENFGTFTATTLPMTATITMDYELKNGMLVISNITTSPKMGIALLQTYGLTFDKVYSGQAVIF